MDNAVALVEAYLRMNGYFTITEYPVIRPAEMGAYKEIGELDVLAFRFPRVRHAHDAGRSGREADNVAVDPALGGNVGEADMIIAEVKEGVAEVNAAAWDPAILRSALTRFGCCEAEDAGRVAAELHQHGHARTRAGHQVRMLAFGTRIDRSDGPYTTVSLGHVLDYIESHLREYWSAYGSGHFKDPALGFLALLEKARRGGRRT